MSQSQAIQAVACLDAPMERAAENTAADREARFAALVASHRERARRLAFRLIGGDAAAADDVTQDAFVRAWAGLDRFRGEASLETWFYRILVRAAYNHRRWRAVRRVWTEVRSDELLDTAAPPPGDPGLRRRIQSALESLTRLQRDSFVLVHMEGFSVRETAGILGRAEGTVKSHLHRALRRLRAELADLDQRNA